MIKIFLLTLLIASVLTQQVVLANSDTTTTITDLGNIPSTLNVFHNTIQPNYLNDGASWIWDSQAAVASGVVRTFEKLFWVDCSQTMGKINITADNLFTAYLNGGLAFGSGAYPTISTFSLTFLCGLNNLTVVVTNKDDNSPAALIFSITQDQSECYICKEGGIGTFFNIKTCKCQCVATGCDCPKPTFWIGYPSCGCQCPPTFVAVICNSSQYYDPQSCSCKCKTVLCPKGFTQNPQTCKCQCRQRKCNANQVWNPDRCQCECKFPVDCIKPKIFSNDSCSCICPFIARCRPGFVWDDKTCSCICLQTIDCLAPRVFSTSTCSCTCPGISCQRGFTLNPVTCKCDPLVVITCAGVACADPHVLDSTTCTCTCPTKASCIVGSVWDQNSCTCVPNASTP